MRIWNPDIFNIVSVTMLSGIGIVIQFLNQLVIAFYFGANTELESFYIGYTIPLYIVSVFNFCINTAFIPKYLDIKYKSIEESERFVLSVLEITFIATVLIFIVGIIFRKNIINFVFPNISSDVSISAINLSILLWTTVFLSPLSIVLSSKMQADKLFFIPAVAPLLNILAVTVILYFFSEKYGIIIYAVSIVIGYIIQLIIIVCYNIRCFSFRLGKFSQHIFDWLKTFVILVGGNIITRITPVMEKSASATQPPGALAELSYANKMIMSISSIITTGLGIISFTKFSEISATKNKQEIQKSIMRVIRLSLLLTIPLFFFLYFNIENLVRIIFMRGRFSETNVQNVSILFKYYLFYFLFANIGNIIGRALYAIKLTKIATFLDAIGVFYYGILLYFFTKYFGIKGVALAFSIYYTVNVTIAGYILLKKIEFNFNHKDIAFILQVMVSSLLMSIPSFLINNSTVLNMMSTIFLSFILFIVGLRVLGNEEYFYIINKIKNDNK